MDKINDAEVTKYFGELIKIVAILRSENGCPWDREQTRESLKPLMLEEMYEAFDAIDRKDEADLREELGDMLLHIVFQAQIAAEEGTFNLTDVLKQLIFKMKKRHPHVFGDIQVQNVDEVLLNWENIKKGEKERESMLSSIPPSLPALLRAQVIQSRVARVGFDWPNAKEVWKKIIEEQKELEEAWKNQDQNAIEEEWGDLVFALVNLSRHLHLQPEEALQKASQRFTQRFHYLENEIKKQGKKIENLSLEEMDELWNKAKQEIKLIQKNQ
ncbi:MAG: nucleoside triphosphate pyrophosphohydrolase [Candidatus Atribacteria bacterium]|nr:nucleoside triphosphate pyrophosphohydrolase [Candidatus Atribacteria bacterium]